MKVTEIKGIVPGAGKTTLLTKLFYKSNLKNKIILTPTNKSRQVCIQNLVSLGMDTTIANKSVSTLKNFKKNYFVCKSLKRHWDMETMEWVESNTEVHYFPCHSEKHYKKIWNIFIDEASMISDVEMQDLLNNWKIQNLILDGDSLQFNPIGNYAKIDKGAGNVDEWIDNGDPYKVKVANQVLLNKSMRAVDERLVKALECIKSGDIIHSMACLMGNRDVTTQSEYKPTDWNICYTNKTCENVNSHYNNPTRFIVANPDRFHGFFTSEIIYEDDDRLERLKQDLFYESQDPVEGSKVPSYEEWRDIHMKPAYAITCHKLQGTTISEGNIFIHLSDILYGLQEVVDIEERAKLFQKFLYVAVSRAVKVEQINIIGLGRWDLIHSINERPMKKVDGKWVPNPKYDTVLNEIYKLQELMGEMKDESIQENAVRFSADDDSVLDVLLNGLEYDEFKASKLEGEDAYHKKYSKSRTKYTDEALVNMTWKELTEATRNAKIRRRWHELHNKSNIGSISEIANIKPILRNRDRYIYKTVEIKEENRDLSSHSLKYPTKAGSFRNRIS